MDNKQVVISEHLLNNFEIEELEDRMEFTVAWECGCEADSNGVVKCGCKVTF